MLLMPSHYTYGEQALNHTRFNPQTSVEITPLATLKLVGIAEMKWLWFEIYQAKLLTPTGTYKPNQWPLALDLLYRRSIPAEQLIQSTMHAWEHQDIDYPVEWVSKLRDIWPDIAPQDQLILYVDDDRISHFFYNNKFIGSLGDPLFSKAFTAIWLSKNTLRPALRNQLIGLNP
tara:strand:- start:441 stop:962 length:522 start_codon:yes stop_codon:yes gene_type:complete